MPDVFSEAPQQLGNCTYPVPEIEGGSAHLPVHSILIRTTPNRKVAVPHNPKATTYPIRSPLVIGSLICSQPRTEEDEHISAKVSRQTPPPP